MTGTSATTSQSENLEQLLPGLRALGASTNGDPSIRIAVLDGPVDTSHSCFSGASLTEFGRSGSAHSQPGLASRHGTHTASILFGQPNTTVRGIAPRCTGLLFSIFEEQPDRLAVCSQFDLARHITSAVQNGANIINLSCGQLAEQGLAEPRLAAAVELCLRENVLLIAAAGNDGCECVHVPAALPGVLVVGASDNAGSPLASSNWGALYRKDGVLAPGVRIHGAAPLNHVAQMTGTSAATAVVSGIAALLMSLQLRRERKISAPFIREAILETAARCPAHRADCDRFLAGSIDVAAATRKVEAPETPARRPNPFIPFHLAPSAGRRSPNPLQSRGIHTMSETMEELLPAATAQAASPETHASGELSAGPAEQAVTPSACGCGCKPKPLVYALGLIGYDLGSEARRDWFIQQGLRNPDNPSEMLEHLTGNPHHSMALTWTLQQETTVTYAIQPSGPFSTMAFDLLRGFLSAQVTSGVQQVSMPGIIQGDASLFNGQSVPVIHPETRGMFSWSTPALVHAVLGPAPEAAEALAKHQLQSEQVENFLERVYYEVRNFGISSSDRALNYAATNAFQVNQVFKSALELEMRLDAISVERSAICRPQSDCWDIKLMFFNPAKRLEQARLLYRFTIDVSDVVPVTVGKIRHWHVY